MTPRAGACLDTDPPDPSPRGTTRIARAGVAFATALATTASWFATATPAQAAPPPDPTVIFFAIDGFDVDYLDGRVPLPHITALARRGAIAVGTGVMSSMTNQSWSSAATGAYPERTKNASYYWDPATNTVRGQSRDIAVETLGESLVAAGHRIASVQWFILENRGVSYGDPDALYTQPGGDCTKRADDVIAILEGRPVDSGGTPVTVPEIPDFLAMYCSDVDSAGHATGEHSQETLDALTLVDQQIGRVIEATKRVGIYHRTTFILSADHGMTTYHRVNGPQVEAAIDALGYRAEWVDPGASPSPDTQVVLAGGGLTSVHLIGDLAGDTRALARITRAIEQVPGIARAYGKAEQKAMRMAPVYGDLIVEPDPGWAMFAEDAPYPRGRHGTTQETRITFLIAGAGVRPGATPIAPRLVDIAPTVSYLLGAEPPEASQGRVLIESLLPREVRV